MKLYRDRPEEVRVRLGSLDDDPEIEIVAQYHVDSKARWVEIECDISEKP